MAVYDLKSKLTRTGQNPDILAIAEALDYTMNRLIGIHNAVQVFDDQLHIRLGEADISIHSDGRIHISGGDISINGAGEVGIRANGDIRLKGARIVQR